MPQTHRFVSIKTLDKAVNYLGALASRFDWWLERAVPFFWHSIWLAEDAPRHHRWPTFEYEWPHRKSRAHVVRLVGQHGVVFGKWDREAMDPDEAGMAATHGHVEQPDVKGEGGESVEEHRERRIAEAAAERTEWTVITSGA